MVISNQFLVPHLQCLHLFQCFFEAGDKKICRYIENSKIFHSKIINLEDTRLSPSDIECVTLFLTCSSHEEWIDLNLSFCYTQDHGVHIIHRGLTNCHVTITTLRLNYNGLTESSSSAISDITIRCRVKVLWINSNASVGEDERLCSIISDPSSILEELYMYSTKLSSSAAIKLFTALSENNKLRVLGISSNNITDEACDAIIMALKKNNTLVKLWMYGNPISEECAQLIIQALQHNNTLQQLDLPNYSLKIRSSAESEVNKERKPIKCQVKL